MDLECGYKLCKDIDLLKNAVHTIGLLKVEEKLEGNLLYIILETKKTSSPIEQKVAKFLMGEIIKNFKYFAATFNYGSLVVRPIISVLNHEETLVITYQFIKDDTFYHKKELFFDLIKALVFAVDEAKVEYCFNIKESEHEIPMLIYCELDTWNDGCIENEEEQECVEPEQLRVYEFDKKMLYGICLGYYPIDITLLENDIIPELIGTVFDSVEDFCYVTSCEDEDKVYVYSATELNEDNIFDIEEGLFNLLGLIIPEREYEYETLEEYYMEVGENE